MKKINEFALSFPFFMAGMSIGFFLYKLFMAFAKRWDDKNVFVDVLNHAVRIKLPKSASGARMGIGGIERLLKQAKLEYQIDDHKYDDYYEVFLFCDTAETAQLLKKRFAKVRQYDDVYGKTKDLSDFIVGNDGFITKVTMEENMKKIRRLTENTNVVEQVLIVLDSMINDETIDDELCERAYGYYNTLLHADEMPENQTKFIIDDLEEFVNDLMDEGEDAYAEKLWDAVGPVVY